MAINRDLRRQLANSTTSDAAKFNLIIKNIEDIHSREPGSTYPFAVGMFEDKDKKKFLAIMMRVHVEQRHVPLSSEEIREGVHNMDGPNAVASFAETPPSPVATHTAPSAARTPPPRSASTIPSLNQPLEGDYNRLIPITAEEAKLLAEAKIPVLSPRDPVPMNLTVGIIFTTLVGIISALALSWHMVAAAGLIWYLVTIFLYVLIRKAWLMFPRNRAAQRVEFSLNSVIDEGANIATLLLGALPWVGIGVYLTASDSSAPQQENFSENIYYQQGIQAIFGAIGFTLTNFFQQIRTNTGYFARTRESIRDLLIEIFTPLFTFPVVLLGCTGMAHLSAWLSGNMAVAQLTTLTTIPGLVFAFAVILGIPAIFHVSSIAVSTMFNKLIPSLINSQPRNPDIAVYDDPQADHPLLLA